MVLEEEVLVLQVQRPRVCCSEDSRRDYGDDNYTEDHDLGGLQLFHGVLLLGASVARRKESLVLLASGPRLLFFCENLLCDKNHDVTALRL
jgi:hypothetical protein